VLCRQTVGAGAVTLAERLRKRVEGTAFRHDGSVIGLTVSIGIAGMSRSIEDPMDLVKAADKALYRAKGDGRNCWRLAKPR
jgi:diguanylate cyclase (GGDEF)-like protein